jgi:hypothetical protein
MAMCRKAHRKLSPLGNGNETPARSVVKLRRAEVMTVSLGTLGR